MILNQNALPTGSYPWRATTGCTWAYQTFVLPNGYQRGALDDEKSIPDLSGLQFYVNIDDGFAESASLEFVFQYYDTGWITLSSGLTIGSHTDGDCWFDVIFPTSVPISSFMVTGLFRIGISAPSLFGLELDAPVDINQDGDYIIKGQKFSVDLVEDVPYPIVIGTTPAYLMLRSGQVTYSIQQGINTFGYVSPSPLINQTSGQGQAYQTDELTPLLGATTTSSMSFRVLGLVGDSGTDFLGNEYRSAVIQSGAGNTDTTGGVSPVSGSTSSYYWMSPPFPSRFAVASRYFDMRPIQGAISYGTVNLIGNPGFEYDYPTSAPIWWTPVTSSATVLDQTVERGWAATGLNSLHMQYTFPTGINQNGVLSPTIPVSPITKGTQTPLTASVAYDIITSSSTVTLAIIFNFYDALNNLVSSSTNGTAGVIGTGTITASTVMPTTATQVAIGIVANSTATGSFEGYVDNIQLTATASALSYFDGDQLGYTWSAQRGASASVQTIQPTTQDQAIVIDSVLVDAITPNMTFNVYYTNDDSGTADIMAESDWETKLWTRVPRVFICDQRQQYAFPGPIKAKYMKVEFTNLQAKSYDPGPFQQPVNYKKFPTWVANFFFAEMRAPSFIVDQIDVQYDALDFAYNYYLDDLHQNPDQPVSAPQGAAAQLTSYFQNSTPSNAVDATTLANINLTMNQFAQKQSDALDYTNLLGAYVKNLYSGLQAPNSTSEASFLQPIDYSTVSTTVREPIIFEQSIPAMYFFLTCRHSYKEISSSFDHNRAYFAGVNSIAFIRHNYTTAADSPLYIESGGDTLNAELNDFVVDSDNNWFSYE